MSESLTASSWGEVATLINSLIMKNPIQGAVTVALSIVVFGFLIALATWSVIQIIRAKNPPQLTAYTILDNEKFTQGVMSLVQDLVEFNRKRDLISRKHEKILEVQITKEKMTLFESTILHVKNNALISFSEFIRESLRDKEPIQVLIELPEYKMFDYAIQRSIDAMIRYFRRMVKEEQFSDKTDIEFQTFTDDCVNKLFAVAKHTFEVNYFMTASFLQTAITSFGKEIDKHYRMFVQALIEVRDIEVSYYKRIEEEEKCYSTEWMTFVSSIPQRILGYIHGIEGK
jgi:hypothetical protein